jgi:hypothetical protein
MGLEVKAISDAATKLRPPPPMAYERPLNAFVDLEGYLRLVELEQRHRAGGWPLPIKGPELDALVARLLPPPPQPRPDLDAVTLQLERDDIEAQVANDLLSPLIWSELFEVLRRLAARGPGLESRTYLEVLEEKFSAHPNVDARITTAMLAELLLKGGRTLDRGDFSGLVRFVSNLIALEGEPQRRILGRMGLDDLSAEALIIALEAIATEHGMVATPAELADVIAAVPFLPWTKPKNMPFHYYIGNAAHVAIAAYYGLSHPKPAHLVWTNVHPVKSIVAALETEFAFKGAAIRAALAAGKPDIFDFSLSHGLPPGWVYEIKPVSWAKIAAVEAEWYSFALTLAGVPVMPGPRNAKGTFGTIAAPHGWFRFYTPYPGVIAYRWQRATKEQLEKAGEKSFDFDTKALREALRLTLTAGLWALLGALVWWLIRNGWRLRFPLPV